MTEGPARNLAADFYRVAGVVLIVLGHWLAGSVTYRDGSFGRQNPLLDQPWTQWLTWLFQAVPVFFLVAGYAAAVSWDHRRADDEMSGVSWVRRRVARVLGPSTVYVVLVSTCVVLFERTGASGSLLEYAGWAVAMHLWFLAVYLIVVSLTPIAVAAQRRWGPAVPAGLAVAVAAVDAASLAGHIPYLGWLNYLLCWGLMYQLGIGWQKGLLTEARAVMLGAGSACALWLLIWLGPYPVSMIGVPGQAVQNTEPPSLAMAAFGCAQAGVAIASRRSSNARYGRR
jgi:fucose 4-O-acetylase-like acetyltransferase